MNGTRRILAATWSASLTLVTLAGLAPFMERDAYVYVSEAAAGVYLVGLAALVYAGSPYPATEREARMVRTFCWAVFAALAAVCFVAAVHLFAVNAHARGVILSSMATLLFGLLILITPVFLDVRYPERSRGLRRRPRNQ